VRQDSVNCTIKKSKSGLVSRLPVGEEFLFSRLSSTACCPRRRVRPAAAADRVLWWSSICSIEKVANFSASHLEIVFLSAFLVRDPPRQLM